jgi:hypothetical protein
MTRNLAYLTAAYLKVLETSGRGTQGYYDDK